MKFKKAAYSLLIFAIIFYVYNLMAAKPAYASIYDGKYGKAQVFDCRRMPAYPIAGTPFTASEFQNMFDDVGGAQFAESIWGTGRYVQFVGPSLTLNLYESDGTFVQTISDSGKIWGLSSTGFLYVSTNNDFGYFISNSTGYSYGESVTYSPDIIEPTSEDLNNYTATSEVLDVGQTVTATLSSIAITTTATKTAYKIGDALDITGMVVTGTYSDTTTKTETITAADVSGFDSSAAAASQTLTVTVGGKTATYTISVAKADGPAAPSAPTLASKTDTSITLTANTLYEFSKNGGANWQDSPVFSGLTAETTYTFIARVKETATTNASAASAGTDVTTNAATLESIAITTSAAKTAYKVGDELDITGMVVTGTYSDTTTKTETVSSANVSGFDSSAVAASQTLTVTVGGKTATYTISVAKADGPAAPSAPILSSKTDTSITLTANTLYEFSKNGGANWQDSPVFSGLTAETTYTFIARVKETATTNASAASAGTDVTTNAATLESIAITTSAAKTAYKVGDELDITGMVVTGTYSDTTTKTETVSSANVSGFDSSAVAASQTLTVTVGGKTATYIISVAKADGPAAPAAPTVASKTDTSVTLTANTSEEFSKDNGSTWQDSPLFSGLTAETTYTFKARLKETATTNASAASAGTSIKTNAAAASTSTGTSTKTNAATSVTPTSTIATITGNVIDDKTGEAVKNISAQVITEANGTKTVEAKSGETILLKQPDGTNSTLGDSAKLSFSAPITTNTDETGINTNVAAVILKSDGTIQINNLPNGTETKFDVTFDLGNGQKITIGTMDVKVSSSGDVSLTSTLIDPYGVITDAATGKVVTGANVTLYYANTDRNIAAGRTPDTAVPLPSIDGFKPNNNINPQISDANGAYAFMVFPNSDYYIVATKDGYNKYTSRTLSVEREIVKWDFKMTQTNDTKGVTRLSGLTRIDTAIEIAKATYSSKVSNVILATAGNYPDALAGSVLAYKLNAPILLVGSSDADQKKVLDYMKSNVDISGTVYILGGTGAISKDMEAKVTASGFNNINRIGGADRYETSAKIADFMKVATGTPIVLVSGENYPDALSVSSAAAVNQYPILLVKGNGIPATILNEISYIKPSKVYIIGLIGAINEAAAQQVSKTGLIDKANVIRIGGADRFETSLEVSKYFNLAGKIACIATGNDFPDALTGSLYAANNNASIILTNKTLSDNELTYIKNNKLLRATIFGGEGAVSKEIEQQLSQLLGQ